MSAVIELDARRRGALEKIARRRKVAPRRLLQMAVDELIRQLGDEELLEESASLAQRSGLRERDSVRIVKDWRSRNKRRSAS